MNKLSYWLGVVVLGVLTVLGFRHFVAHGWTMSGIAGLVFTLVCFAVFLSFALSMRNRDRRSPPIAR